MAMAGHLLQLKHPGTLSLSPGSLGSARPTRPKQCSSRAKAIWGPIAHLQVGGGRLRHGFVPVGGNSRRREGFGNLGFGGRGVVDSAAGEGEVRGTEVVVDEVADEDEPEENNSFPAEFRDLIVDRGDPPNYYLYAAGFVLVVLMRDVIVQEIARWGINFCRLVLYAAEGITMIFIKLTDVAVEPIAFMMAVVQWAVEAVGEVYTLIVDAPVTSLANSLLLSLAVLSIGDATASKIKGSRSRLVGIATAIGLAGVLEFISPKAMVLSLLLLTAFTKIVQKADLVTVFMPVTVAFVTISKPVLRAAAFGVFFAVSVYAHWRAARQPTDVESSEQTPSEVLEREASAGKRPSFLFSAITASICISLSARFLYLRTVKWLALRSA